MSEQNEKIFDAKQGKMVDKNAEAITPEQAFRDETLKLLRTIKNAMNFFVLLAVIGIMLGILAYCSPLH